MAEKPIYIYLDQNKWIDLSRAYYDMTEGQKFKRILDKIQKGISNKKIICPLSFEHVFETRKKKDLTRRKRLATVMSEISQGNTISPQSIMRKWELSRALGDLFQKPSIYMPSAFGVGIPFALGKEFVVKDEDGNRIEMPEKFHLEVDKTLTSLETMLSFFVDNDEATNLKAHEEYNKSQEEFIKRVEIFRQKSKKQGKTKHRYAYMMSLIIAIQNELKEPLELYNETLEKFFQLEDEKIISSFENCPTINTEVSLVVSRNEQWDKKIKINDSMDISFLTVAIPYCDIVVTEKFLGTLIRQNNLHEKYSTQIFSDLNELESILS
jgi:hypothetical protein